MSEDLTTQLRSYFEDFDADLPDLAAEVAKDSPAQRFQDRAPRGVRPVVASVAAFLVTFVVIGAAALWLGRSGIDLVETTIPPTTAAAPLPDTLTRLNAPPVPLDPSVVAPSQIVAVPERDWLVMVGASVPPETGDGDEGERLPEGLLLDGPGTFVYSYAEDAWYEMATNEQPGPRGFVFYDQATGRVGLVESADTERLGAVWMLDLGTGSWERLADAVPAAAVAFDPAERRLVAITQARVADPEEIPAAWVSLIACQCAKVWRVETFDLDSGSWTHGAELPEPADARQTAAVIDPSSGRLIVLQHIADPLGEDDESGTSLKIVSAWEHDLETGEWTALPSPDSSQRGAFLWEQPVILDPLARKLAVFTQADTLVFDLETSTWTRVAVRLPADYATAAFDPGTGSITLVRREGNTVTVSTISLDPEIDDG